MDQCSRNTPILPGFSRRAGDRRFSPCTKAYHAGCKFWIHFIFGTTLNVSTIETKRFLLSARKCSENAGYAVFRGSMPPDPPRCSNSPLTSILSPPTMLHLGEPCTPYIGEAHQTICRLNHQSVWYFLGHHLGKSLIFLN